MYSLGIQLKLLGATLTIFEDNREVSLEIVKNQIESHKKILEQIAEMDELELDDE
ncbi:hypothetical protein QUF88_13185 [Bacillus sp. DX1.1]|uniref:hypothetical protein n=1 Tax=unclassified Bacillus (in: firmicutes) TaxID=185979 RepID=UPI002571144B|nr:MULTISPECIES: hypothetical protein [unclassified Bacillus (in: firmicutes)]MDM5154745.1 hypothetical protein [Bacillus sp. DX1.1]WJE83627.1 hypothetical protein QRE67_10680 [Bacillus sp. DX3.1]